MQKKYLAIDIGASSGRHIVGWMENGVLRTEEVYRFPNSVQRVNGHLKWDIDSLFANVKNGIREACKYVTDVNLFDVYEGIQLGPDKKSMAFSVVFTPQEEELTGEMVEGFVKKILKHLEATLDIRLRA